LRLADFASLPTGGKSQSESGPSTFTLACAQNNAFRRLLEFHPPAFVLVGKGSQVATSPSGTGWALRDSGATANLAWVRYANGLFVAVGDNGTMWVSSNGTAWCAWNPGTTTTL
jgi:hypothetical protein